MTIGRRDERGLTLILFALMLSALLVFVALALDSGLVFNQRRQDQSAADAAALAAMKELIDLTTPADNRIQAAQAAFEVSWDNLGSTTGSSTESEWIDRWASGKCSDPNAYPVVSSLTPCISFLADDSRVRVKLPTVEVGSTFGQVVGVNDFETTASAEAEALAAEPYALFGSAIACDEASVAVHLEVNGNGNGDGNEEDETTIRGPVHSNGRITLNRPPAINTNRLVTYVIPPAPSGLVSARVSSRPDPLGRLQIEAYDQFGALARQATAAGSYRYTNSVVNDAWIENPNNDALENGRLKDVLIYTTNRVDLKRPREGRATFVSTGTIGFQGSGFNISPWSGNRILAFSTAGDSDCEDDAIEIDASDSTFNGVMYAPNGMIRSEREHENRTFNGGLIAYVVNLDGTGYVVNNDPGFPFPTVVRLYR
jgi:Flp pilus assembly protein TadG